MKNTQVMRVHPDFKRAIKLKSVNENQTIIKMTEELAKEIEQAEKRKNGKKWDFRF